MCWLLRLAHIPFALKLGMKYTTLLGSLKCIYLKPDPSVLITWQGLEAHNRSQLCPQISQMNIWSICHLDTDSNSTISRRSSTPFVMQITGRAISIKFSSLCVIEEHFYMLSTIIHVFGLSIYCVLTGSGPDMAPEGTVLLNNRSSLNDSREIETKPMGKIGNLIEQQRS